jgi:hypothetical protein
LSGPIGFFVVFLAAFFFTPQSTAQSMPEKKVLRETPQEVTDVETGGASGGPSSTDPSAELEDAKELDEATTVGRKDETVPLIRKQRSATPPLFRQERRYIEHPNARRGLVTIDKNRNYFYRVPQSESKYMGSFRLGTFEPTNLTNPARPDLSFRNLYDENNFPMFIYEFEKPFLRSPIGHINWQLGAGLYFAQGSGVFANGSPIPPLEKFSLFVFPVSASLVYRMQFFDDQFFVPYASGGFDAFCFAERRDDDLNPGIGAKLGWSPMGHFSLGGAFRLGRGPRAFVDLDREYGINSMSVIAEYRSFVDMGGEFDFSSDFFGAGLLVTY